jgi:hypothetical protein
MHRAARRSTRFTSASWSVANWRTYSAFLTNKGGGERDGESGGRRKVAAPITPFSPFPSHRRVVRHPHGQAALGVVILNDAPGGQRGGIHKAGGAGGKGVPVRDLHGRSFVKERVKKRGVSLFFFSLGPGRGKMVALLTVLENGCVWCGHDVDPRPVHSLQWTLAHGRVVRRRGARTNGEKKRPRRRTARSLNLLFNCLRINNNKKTGGIPV